MFAYHQPSFSSLLGYLEEQQNRERCIQAQRNAARAAIAAAASSPKIIKKVETEEAYQIQIFKSSGNFNSYEVKAVKPPAFGAYDFGLVNLVIESAPENFKKVFQFNLEDIKLSEVDWEWYRAENVLVLNIPKKIKVCHDAETLAALFGLNLAPYGLQYSQEEARAARDQAQVEREAEREAARREAEKEAARREAARIEAAKKEAQRQEAERKARRIAEERARREAEVRARRSREAQEKARLEAEARAQKAREEAQKAGEEAQRKAKETEQHRKAEYEQIARKQQEFIQDIFSQMFGVPFQYNAAANNSSETAAPESTASQEKGESSQPEPQAMKKESTLDEAFDTHDLSDNESIASEPETAESTPASSPAPAPTKKTSLLSKVPSIEEVEDEEFVIFRKKFNQ